MGFLLCPAHVHAAAWAAGLPPLIRFDKALPLVKQYSNQDSNLFHNPTTLTPSSSRCCCMGCWGAVSAGLRQSPSHPTLGRTQKTWASACSPILVSCRPSCRAVLTFTLFCFLSLRHDAHTGEFAAAPPSSPAGSSGGCSWVVDDACIEHWLRHHLREAVLYLPSADADWQPDQQVWLPPLLAIMSLKHMSYSPAPLAKPPLTARLADAWRDWEQFSDLMMLVLRLQLLAAEAALAGNLNSTCRDCAPLCDVLPGELPEAFDDALVKLPGAGMQLAPKVVSTHLSDSDFLQLCTQASYDGGFAFVGPGNNGPDAWLVLQLTCGQRLVVVVQSRKRAVSQQTCLADVEAEAAKCWEAPLQQLMVFVTDTETDNISGPITHTRVPVVVVGRPTHERFYTQAGAFVKASIAVARANAEAKRQRTK